MNKCDYMRRLKHIAREECEIIKNERKIAVKSANYYKELSSLKAMLLRQKQELLKYNRIVENFKSENCYLDKSYKHREEERLRNINKKVEQMQTDYQQKCEQQKVKMNCIRSLKLATQTAININAMPHYIQGVTTTETEFSTKWKPFRLDREMYTVKEIQDIIWEDKQIDFANKEIWEALILEDILDEETKKECGNITVII